MLDPMELFEALYTTRAMRRVAPDPVPEETVKIMIDAAVRAPSGGNTQNWRFVTVTDEAARAALGPLYRESFNVLQETVYKGNREQAETRGDEGALRVMNSSAWLAENFEKVPLWVFAFHRNDPTGASIYPAVWSLMLAARGQGVGTCLTTILGMFKATETFEVLGVPLDKGWALAAAVSCGYPTGRWGLAQRRAVQDRVYDNQWGDVVSWEMDESHWQEPAGYGR